jgi:hypothetical protein
MILRAIKSDFLELEANGVPKEKAQMDQMASL